MMNEINVGKLLNITYDIEKKTMRITIEILNDTFKEQLLRNNKLIDKIKIVGEDLIWIANMENT